MRCPTRSALLIPCLSLVLAAAAHAQGGTEDRPVAAFTKLRVQNGIDVDLIQADSPGLRIEAENYALEDVLSEVADGELRLSLRRSPDWSLFSRREVSAQVRFVALSAVSAAGGSDVESENALRVDDLSVTASGGSDVDLELTGRRLEFSLSGGSDLDLAAEAESLTISASGGSDASLSGRADTLDISASGGSDVSARSLQSARVKLNVSGGSDASVHAAEAVDIKANGGSDVMVFGNPDDRKVDNDRSSDVVWR